MQHAMSAKRTEGGGVQRCATACTHPSHLATVDCLCLIRRAVCPPSRSGRMQVPHEDASFRPFSAPPFSPLAVITPSPRSRCKPRKNHLSPRLDPDMHALRLPRRGTSSRGHAPAMTSTLTDRVISAVGTDFPLDRLRFPGGVRLVLENAWR